MHFEAQSVAIAKIGAVVRLIEICSRPKNGNLSWNEIGYITKMIDMMKMIRVVTEEPEIIL